MNRMIRLGVNVDHVATLRQQRKGIFPDPVEAALAAQAGGADGIVAHLREDRRHIQDRDVLLLQKKARRFNMEMAATREMESIAFDLSPRGVCLVPEKRQELTTEGGLNVIRNRAGIEKLIVRLSGRKIRISLFIDPEEEQIRCARDLGADAVELHTGRYADARGARQAKELRQLKKASEAALKFGLHLHSGHGLDYQNVKPVAQIEGMEELNIGFSIISRAIFVGMEQAVREMKKLITPKNSSPLKGEG